MAQTAGLRAHLRLGLRREREPELRDEPETAQDAEGVLAEALRGDGSQLAASEVADAAERVDELARLEALARSR